MCVTDPRIPLDPNLYERILLGNGRCTALRQPREVPAFPSSNPRLAILAATHERKRYRTPHPTTRSSGLGTHRRVRYGVWRDAESSGLLPRRRWIVFRSRGVELARSCGIDNVPRTETRAAHPSGLFRKEVGSDGSGIVLLHGDNQAVMQIIISFVSASGPHMQELRRLKTVLTNLNVHGRSFLVPSAFNRFSDAFSRRFPRRDLQIRR